MKMDEMSKDDIIQKVLCILRSRLYVYEEGVSEAIQDIIKEFELNDK